MPNGTRALQLGAIFAGIVLAQDGQWTGLMQRARQLEESGQFVPAVALYRQAAALADSSRLDDAHRIVSYNLLGVAYQQAGLPAESMHAFRRELEIIKGSIGTRSVEYAAALANLGTVISGAGDPAAGEVMQRDALRIETDLGELNTLTAAGIETGLSDSLLSRGRYREAERLIEAAAPVVKKSGEAIDQSIVLNNLGLVRAHQHRYDEALELVSEAAALMEGKYGSQHPLLLRPLANLATLYGLTGRIAEAESAFRRVGEICEKSLPPDHPWHAVFLSRYAEFLRHSGAKARARAMEKEARSLASENRRRDGTGLTVDAMAFTRH
jgi:tetratricopeptide (TPR) repeat protein